MTRPQVAVGGTVSRVESNCEYIEQTVADGQQGVVFYLGFERGGNN